MHLRHLVRLWKLKRGCIVEFEYDNESESDSPKAVESELDSGSSVSSKSSAYGIDDPDATILS